MKKAFTLTELLITMAIISFIAVLTMTTSSYNDTLKQKKITYKYASALRALDIAAKTLVKDDDNNPFGKMHDGNEATTEYESLCKGLVDYINGTNSNCNAGNNLSGNYLYATNTNTNYSNLTPNIKAQNGINIYVSDKQTTTYDEQTVEFFLVYVDINVNKKHTIEYNLSKNVFPDVYAFAIVPTGNAIPLGLPEYNKFLLPVEVEYVVNRTFQYSNDYSYHEAKHYAWNWYKTDAEKTNEFIETMPYSYNEPIRAFLVSQNTQLYAGLGNPTYSTNKLANCNEFDYNACFLKFMFPKYIK